MTKKRVLFVCIHNSARSQMAEAFLNSIGSDRFEAFSAGLEPGKLNSYAVEVMKESGIDISGNKTKAVADLFNVGQRYDYVITVCDSRSAETCPVIPGQTVLHWEFPDPSALEGSHEERLEETRKIRDMIREKVEVWIREGEC
ncbi:MAG: arsenate reductase ArsC [Nitrospirales bacterium]|nr:arsenate reductase ArsC [Nitrospirales bacterium]